MDELPSEAKRILTLAKGAQPAAQAGTRERVRERVDAALAATALVHAEQSTHAISKVGRGRVFLTSTKIMLASGALLIGGGSALWHRQGPPDARARPAPQTELAQMPPAAEEEAHAAPEPSAAPREPIAAAPQLAEATLHPRVSHAPSGPSAHGPQLALGAEVSLLAQAAEALNTHDIARARAALGEHRRRFKQPQLREERDGLSIVVRCLDKSEGAQDSALIFLRKRPSSMLAAQIKRACALTDGT